MKATFQVAVGSNEAAVVEFDIAHIGEWDSLVLPALRKIEERVGERSRRIMAANEQLKSLAKTSPEMANLVQNLVLLALGNYPNVGTQGLVDGAPNSVPELRQQAA